LVEVAAAVSHEVANAVGTIRGWAELALHSDPLGDRATVDTRDALTLIRAAARSAEQAARSMLSLARGEAAALEGQPLDLSTFASELLQLLTLTAREARVTLESSIEPGLHVLASRAQLFTILFNLLKNAVEACGPGGLVSVQATGDRESVRVSVRDTGTGLDSQAKKRIFERYYTTKSTGTGLGLALVHSTAEASGARIEVDSEPGRGTVFRVILPRVSEPTFALTPVPESAWSSAHPSEALGQPLELRVLVVDDDHALREMLATALSLRGADVISVRSSQEALELHGNFDIALIDMMLDDCRGDELLATLRQRGVVNAAMLVTGTVQKPRLVPGGEPDDWVRKPFEISHLVDRIRRTLERHRMLVDAGQIARA
jgi:CheY-like chemotaxis protein